MHYRRSSTEQRATSAPTVSQSGGYDRKCSPSLLQSHSSVWSGMSSALARVLDDLHYAWYGPSMLITSLRGSCDGSHQLTGYYYREARHLNVLRLELNGTLPWLCAGGITNQRQLDFVFVYPELTHFGGGGTDSADDETSVDAHHVPQRAIDVRLTERLRFDGLDLVLTLANRSAVDANVSLSWVLAADFA